MPGVASPGAEEDSGPVREGFNRRSFGAASTLFEEESKNFSSVQQRVKTIVESQVADVVMGFFITVNAVLVVLETNCKGLEEDVPMWLNICTTSLIVLYTLELVARLYVYGRFFFASSWNMFDFFVVGTDIIAEVIGRIFGDVLPSISVLRIFRVLRLLRLVEFLTVFQELHTMVRLMISSLRTMFWGAVLLVVTITLWSIVFVELLHPLVKDLANEGKFGDCERCGKAFETVYQSNLTLFQTLVFGDSWGMTSVVLIESHPWTSALLVAAGVCLQVGLLNLILTVIVDKAAEQHKQDAARNIKKKEREFEKAKDALMKCCESIDDDKSGELGLEELMAGFNTNKEFAMTLSLMDIKAEDMNVVFNILDEDQSGTVTYAEFVDQLYKMKSQDSHTMLLFIKGYVNELRGKVTEQMRILKINIIDKLEEISSVASSNAKARAESAKAGATNGEVRVPSKEGTDVIKATSDAANIGDGQVIFSVPVQKELELCTQKLNGISDKLDAQVTQTFQQLQASIGDIAGSTARQPSRFFQSCEPVKPNRQPATLAPMVGVATRSPPTGLQTPAGYPQGSPDSFGGT